MEKYYFPFNVTSSRGWLHDPIRIIYLCMYLYETNYYNVKVRKCRKIRKISLWYYTMSRMQSGIHCAHALYARKRIITFVYLFNLKKKKRDSRRARGGRDIYNTRLLYIIIHIISVLWIYIAHRMRVVCYSHSVYNIIIFENIIHFYCRDKRAIKHNGNDWYNAFRRESKSEINKNF